MQPSFIDLFEKTFNNQLSFEAKSIKGVNISKAVNTSDIKYLLEFIQSQFKIEGENGLLVLLNLLHDAWYSGDFSKSAIELMVKSEVFAKNKNNIIQRCAANIYEKFTFLQPGNIAPEICLNDLTGKSSCTNHNNEKFKYIIFDSQTS